MKRKVLIEGEALQASVVSALAAEQFLNNHFSFRRNVLNGKVEFASKKDAEQEPSFRPLTQEALNSIILQAKREDVCEGRNQAESRSMQGRLMVRVSGGLVGEQWRVEGTSTMPQSLYTWAFPAILVEGASKK